MTRLRCPSTSPRHSQQGFWQILGGAALGAGLDFLGNESREDLNNANLHAQREFAQMGIRWKVADAKAAGIHPLYALGAQGASYSPTITAGDDWSNTGQALQRAFATTQSDNDRLGTFMQEQEKLADARVLAKKDWETNQIMKQHQIQGQSIQNDNLLLDNEAKRLLLLKTLREMGPAMPAATGAAPFGATETKPSEQISADPRLRGLEAASTPGFKTYRYGNRSIDLPNEALSESLEGQGAMGHVLAPILFGQHYWDKWGVPEWFSSPRKGHKRVFKNGRIVEVPR